MVENQVGEPDGRPADLGDTDRDGRAGRHRGGGCATCRCTSDAEFSPETLSKMAECGFPFQACVALGAPLRRIPSLNDSFVDGAQHEFACAFGNSAGLRQTASC